MGIFGVVIAGALHSISTMAVLPFEIQIRSASSEANNIISEFVAGSSSPVPYLQFSHLADHIFTHSPFDPSSPL